MEETTFLEILKGIENCLERYSIDIANDLINLELDNLKGITEHKCQNTKYYFGSYCKYCSNLNCNSNKNKV